MIALELPPLRERPGDIGLLARALVERHARRLGRRPPEIAAEALAALERHTWPGNVRELANTLERAVVLGGGERITLGDLPEDLLRDVSASGSPEVAGPPAARRDLGEIGEKELRDALEASAWRPFAAARRLGIPRPSIYHLIRRFPSIRLAADLERPELETLLERHGRDLPAIARELGISPLALRRRLGQLGLEG